MAGTGSTVDKVYRRQVRVRIAVLRQRRSSQARWVAEAETDLVAALAEVRNSGDLVAMLESERTMLMDEYRQFANTPEMKGSLETALAELEGAAAMVELVHDPAAYTDRVDATHRFRTHRIGRVPRDDARMFFRAHGTRLQNLSKARGTDEEKAVLTARRKNMLKAEQSYRELQSQALGIDEQGGAGR